MLSNRLQIRFRIDGVLEDLEPRRFAGVCADAARARSCRRLKILGKLDIAERRRPQDGSFRVKVDREGQQRERRLAGLRRAQLLRRERRPPHPGPAARPVLDRPARFPPRRQPKASAVAETSERDPAGHRPDRLRQEHDPLRLADDRLPAGDPHSHRRGPDRIRLRQFSASPKSTNRSAIRSRAYLRAFLRHDPEVIMVGEIRDEETAEMAFRAAQTGHLLLSTLHTNTRVGAIPRLMDLKIDPNTLASSLIGVVGQRLVRQICDECKVPYQPSEAAAAGVLRRPPAGPGVLQGRGLRRMQPHRLSRTAHDRRTVGAERGGHLLINKSRAVRRDSRQRPDEHAVDGGECLGSSARGADQSGGAGRMLPYSAVSDFRQRRFGKDGAVCDCGVSLITRHHRAHDLRRT